MFARRRNIKKNKKNYIEPTDDCMYNWENKHIIDDEEEEEAV